MGISVAYSEVNEAMIAIAVHDGTYLNDFCVHQVSWAGGLSESKCVSDCIISDLCSNRRATLSKYIGVGLPLELVARMPQLCSRLWVELDMVPIGLATDKESTTKDSQKYWDRKSVEEQADSVARKCIMSVLFSRTFVPNIRY